MDPERRKNIYSVDTRSSVGGDGKDSVTFDRRPEVDVAPVDVSKRVSGIRPKNSRVEFSVRIHNSFKLLEIKKCFNFPKL